MSIVSPNALRGFHAALHCWYEAHGRKHLPWRQTADPYEIYVSEIMLQQTQVATVLERYYFPFLKRFPTLKALAAARREEVLKAWQGLGYYNRAVNLHHAAQKSGGALPDTPEMLMSLPGIGRNTAHAVAALAFKKPVAVMEANVKRVLCRIFALKTPGDMQLWDSAQALLDEADPFEYNQAMMDIGAMICKKRAPLCDACPANSICKGKVSPESYPAPKIKKAVPVRRKNILVIRNARGEYYASPRKGKFLNGMYHFIESDSSFPRKRESLSPPAFGDKEIPCAGMTKIGNIRQQYSHFTLEADVYLARAENSGGKCWHGFAALKKLPHSMAEEKILALLPKEIPGRKRA